MRKVSSASELVELSHDAGIEVIRPAAAYYAENEAEVGEGLRSAAASGLPVTPRGGGTSIPSQSVGQGVILLQRRNQAVVKGSAVVCEPAVVKSELNKFLLGAGIWMPVDPSSYASCTVGGMVANNASGVRTPKYGSTIDFVTEMRVVTAADDARLAKAMPIEQALTGEPWLRKAASLIIDNSADIEREKPRVTKNSSGYRIERVVHDGAFDLPKLFVGSEGTLGVFTEITLSTRPRPRWRSLFIVESSLGELDRAVGAFRGLRPTALELVDKSVFRMMNRWDRVSRYSRSDDPYMVFCELDGEEGDGGKATEAVADSEAGRYDPMVILGASEVQAAWDARNESLALAQDARKGRRRVLPGVEDLVVPPERLGDLVRLLTDQFAGRGLESICYGHAGDANLHARPFLDPSDSGDMSVLDELMEDCFEAVWKMGGSMTGEHGDGRLRAKYVERQYPRTYWIMRELKRILDPKGVMNPGVKIV